MTNAQPSVTRTYRNHHLDSTRWEAYDPREGDVAVVTSYKSGTTWMQHILGILLYGEAVDPFALQAAVPWVECRFRNGSVRELRRSLAALPGRRLLKTHLPLDGRPYHANVRYVIVARDRGLCMRLFFAMLNEPDGRSGDPLPPCPDHPRAFWRNWITRGFFEWEREGWPFWANMGHTLGYWRWRHLPNLLFVHYADMLADLPAVARRVAAFVGVPLDEEAAVRLAAATRFEAVKEKALALPPASDRLRHTFSGGLPAFYFMGTNGRWRQALTEEDLALYDQAKSRLPDPACARWLEQGGLVRS